jgi:acetyltransferase-like isoleucine patch superfamily enzyme
MAINAVVSALRASYPWRLFRNRLRFPGLNLDPGVELQVDGRVLHGSGCSIGRNSILIVPRLATLSLGEGVYVGRNVELGPQASIGIGDATSIQDRSILLGEVKIGRYCSLSLNVLISSGHHYYDLVPNWLIRDQDAHVLADGDLSRRHHRPVCVEDDCWLGVNTVIMPGVSIGKGCVVGANSVVTRDLPPYVVAAGAPARIIKTRLSFEPPRRIDAAAEADLPYFYSGIGVSRLERTRAEVHQGLLGGDEFSLALDPRGARHICLIARSNARDTCVVHYLDNGQELSPEFREIRFALADADTFRFCFKVHPASGRWPIVIKKAWVE